MENSDEKYLQEGLQILKEGGIVIFPTDTAFGIGCRVDNEEAIKKVFSIRKRPANQAVPVLISGVDMAQRYVTAVPKKVRTELIDTYWPGALTIVLPARRDKISALATGGGLTIGLRVPNHPIPLRVIKSLQVPLIGPSANFHGESTPYQLSDLNPKLFNLVDYIIPGVCSTKKESTVIDCSTEQWKVLRKGAISL